MQEYVYGPEEMYPEAVSVSALDDFRLKVGFSNGETRIFDVKNLFVRKPYMALKNPILFQKVGIEYGAVTWVNGLNIDPEWMYEESVAIEG